MMTKQNQVNLLGSSCQHLTRNDHRNTHGIVMEWIWGYHVEIGPVSRGPAKEEETGGQTHMMVWARCPLNGKEKN